MNNLTTFAIAMGLSVGGVLFFIAGSPGMHIMPRNYANFAGIASLMFSGVAWAVWAQQQRGK